MGYREAMDILTKLESAVGTLVAERDEARAELARARTECSTLEDQNRALRQSLEVLKSRQEKTLARLDGLIGSIEAHVGAEKVS